MLSNSYDSNVLTLSAYTRYSIPQTPFDKDYDCGHTFHKFMDNLLNYSLTYLHFSQLPVNWSTRDRLFGKFL